VGAGGAWTFGEVSPEKYGVISRYWTWWVQGGKEGDRDIAKTAVGRGEKGEGESREAWCAQLVSRQGDKTHTNNIMRKCEA